jgi:hypothetical protein
LPANTDWVVTGAPSPGWTSTPSVISPDPVLIANRAAISLPSGVEVINTAAGPPSPIFSTSWASAPACGATRKPAISASSTT